MKKVLLIILLLLAMLLIPAVAFAGEKTTPVGNKPASASAKKGKVKEKCVIPKLEHEEKLPSGETIIVKDPIPETLSDKRYCKAVRQRYIHYIPDDYMDPPREMICIVDQFTMSDKELECFSEVFKIQARDPEHRRIHFQALKRNPSLANCP